MSDLATTEAPQAVAPSGPFPDGEAPPKGSSAPFQQRPAAVVAFVAFTLIIAVYFWFIQHYSVNTISFDQWSDITLLRRVYSGHLTLGSLWAQHGEDRILLQNLIVIVLAYTTHFNVVVEEYLSGVMAIAATAMFVLAHRRRSPSTPWLYYIPVVLVTLSFVQEGNMLFGFAIGWYIVLLALAGTIYVLDRLSLTWLALTGGIVIAILGSLSNLYGLLIWPAGFVLLFLRRRPSAHLYAWIASALATGVVYFINFNFGLARSNNGYVFSHPVRTIQFFLIALGDGLGIQSTSGFYPDVAILGLGIFAVSCWVLTTYGRRRDESSGSPIGVAMICFGLPFCALLTVGRAWFGQDMAGWSRYTTYDLLVLAGCYVAVLNRPAQPAHSEDPTDHASGLPRENASRRARGEVVWIAVATFLIAAIGLQVFLGTSTGISQAGAWHQSQLLAADVTVNIDKAPDYLVYNALDNNYHLRSVRQDAAFARAHDLSLFATPAVSQYTREGLLSLPVSTWVLKPSYGARLRGDEWLVAAAGGYGASRINFVVNGGNLHKELVLPATLTNYGWIGNWYTIRSSNGAYTIRSIAYSAAGNGTWSSPVPVFVSN